MTVIFKVFKKLIETWFENFYPEIINAKIIESTAASASLPEVAYFFLGTRGTLLWLVIG